jgi:LuxR family maltose regulon positive regulatory protein
LTARLGWWGTIVNVGCTAVVTRTLRPHASVAQLRPTYPFALHPRSAGHRPGCRTLEVLLREAVVASPLLETKFHVPTRRRGLVARTRLNERLCRAGESALTLVSAPAGFGKTTLLTDWLTTAPTNGHATAWLSLDRSDNDPALFWAYFIAALKAAAPGVGNGALALLPSTQSPTEAFVVTLLNDLAAVSIHVVVVLDDYHVIEDPDIRDAMAYLVEHLPPQIRLVIASRADPALPLARLRARGELVEIRAADLRFTLDETAAYLNDVMALELTSGDVAALEGRTEGWIAAIQLAALSMQGRDDVAGFIAGFAGDDRYIVDYLVGEVLQRQPEQVRSFLLRTSILSRLNGSLCDAVTGQDGGRAMLEALDRGNLFLVPLDDRRLWYRYHHLFADVLRARLLDEQHGRVHELHRRASDWYARNGDRSAAIGHALDGEDFERGADLVELAAPAMRQTRQEATLRRWLEALPEELFRVRPVLAMALVGEHIVRGEIEGVEALLKGIELLLEAPATATERPGVPSTAMVVIDHEEFRRLPNQIAVHRAGQALLLGDVAGTMTHARRALELAAEDNHLGHGAAAGLLALAHWNQGDLDAAHGWYTNAIASLEHAGHLSDVLGLALADADVLITQGRLGDAMSTYRRGLKVAAGQAPLVLRGTADMHVGIGELLRERNDLDAALQHLGTSTDLGEHAGLPQNAYRSLVALARIRQAQGDPASAEDLLDEAERVYTGDFSPDVRPVAALRARVQLAQGKVGDALAWANQRQLSATDRLSYVHEFEHIILARALLAQNTTGRADGPRQEATQLLDRLLAAAKQGQRTGSVIDIMVLQALAYQARADVAAALARLEQALTLAEPEGYVRVFLDEGPAITTLLRAAAQQGPARDYARHLLASDRSTAPRTPVQRGLVDPLSERELHVLRLLRSDLSGPDIARELMVSLNTMRTHTKNIYAKLGVNNRRAAVSRAEELKL